MGKFGDKIKERLNEGDIEFSDSSWEKMDKKLSESSYQTQFEQKIQETFSEGTVIMPEGSWNNFNENSNLLNNFEKNLSEKLNSGKYKSNENNWDDFSEKYTNSRLTSFEKTIKNALNSKKLGTNHIHWKAFEKILHGNRVKKIFWRSAAVLFFSISTGIGINQILKKESKTIEDIDSSVNNGFVVKNTTKKKKNLVQKSNINEKEFDLLSLEKRDDEVSSFNQNKIFKNVEQYQTRTIDKKHMPNKKSNFFPKIEAEVKTSTFSSLEVIKHHVSNEVKSEITMNLHPGATLWLNFWDNPALTGFYGKNNISCFFINDWELIDENKDNKGEFSFVQPVVRIGAYERILNKNWSIGGFLNYQLNKNWNTMKYSTSISYTKKIFRGYHFRFGAGATFISQNLAVNKLTLRERVLNSNYIYTTQLGNLKSKEEYSSTYHIGGFLNHEKFFLGYTFFNFGSNNFTNDNNVILKKHSLIGGLHTPEYMNIKVSGLFKFEKELFTSYSPAIGVTFNNMIFTMYEYENLSGRKISLGYQVSNRIRAQFNYNIKSLEDYQNRDLNLDNFTDRRGYLSGGVNYIF